MRRNEAIKAVVAELSRRGISWTVENRGKHPAVVYLGHRQIVTGSRARTSAIANAVAYTKRVIRKAQP